MTAARDIWMNGARRLAEAGIESARLDARVLLAEAMKVPPEEIFSAVVDGALESYDALIARRIAREPLAYIVGRKEFWSLPFAVGPGVLVPRPETETLVEEAIRNFPDRNRSLAALDLGAGSGCLLITFLKNYPQALGTGVDRSAAALAWGRRNAGGLGVAARCTWREGDWDAAKGATYDVIFANPPYLRLDERETLSPEIARYEPSEALFAGADGLDAYRALSGVIARALQPKGCAFIEIGAGQRDAVCAILSGRGLEIKDVVADLSGIPRCIAVGLASVNSGTEAEKTVGNRRSSR